MIDSNNKINKMLTITIREKQNMENAKISFIVLPKAQQTPPIRQLSTIFRLAYDTKKA